MAGLSKGPNKATRGPAGGIKITSPGSKRWSAVVLPSVMNLYKSKRVMVLLSRISWMLRKLPLAAGPPVSNKALIRVDRLDKL